MLATKLQILDNETGEINSLEFREVIPRKKRDRSFKMLQDGALSYVLAVLKRNTDLRVFCSLVEAVTSNNEVRLPRAELMRVSCVSESQVCTSLKRLEELGIISRDKADKNHFFVSPELVWRGFRELRPAAVRKWLSNTSPNLHVCSCGERRMIKSEPDFIAWWHAHGHCG